MHCRRGKRNEVIRRDLNFMGLSEDMAQDRCRWKSKIKIADPRSRVPYPLFAFVSLDLKY